MRHYTTKKLAAVCDISAGNTAPQDMAFFKNGSFPFFRTSDIGKIHLGTIYKSQDLINARAAKSMRLFPKGTILFPKSGASASLNHRVKMGVAGYVVSHLATIKANNDYLTDDFLLYYLITIDAKSLLKNNSYPSLNISDLSELTIPIPSLSVQKWIVERLDKVQELIAKQKEQIAKLDLLIKSRFLDMFGDPLSNPKKWPSRRMGDIFKITSGGTPSRKKSEHFENGTIPWVKTGDLNVPYLTHTDEYITEIGLQNSSAKLFPVGTVLLAMYGATIGAVSILGIEACSNQACAAFLPVDTISPIYLYFFLFLQKQHFIKLGVGGAQPNISGEILKRERILYPPAVLQTQFANFVKSVEQQKEVFSTRLSHLEVLYKSLMQEYFG